MTRLQEAAAKGGGPLVDLLTEILMRADADRRLVLAAASAVEEISADTPFAAVLLGAAAPQLRAQALLVLNAIEGDPYALLQPAGDLRRATIALKNAVDGLRDHLAQIQSEAAVAAEAALLAGTRKSAQAEECNANPLLVPLVYEGPVRPMLDIGNLAGREQGEARLIFAREITDIRVNVKTTETEKDVPNCKNADFLARTSGGTHGARGATRSAAAYPARKALVRGAARCRDGRAKPPVR